MVLELFETHVKKKFPMESSSSSTSPVLSSTTTPLLTSSPASLISNLSHLVSAKLNRGNYLTWKAQMVPYLRGHQVFGYIDGTTLPPTQTIPNNSPSPDMPDTVANPEFLL
jgi:hypothetical protein